MTRGSERTHFSSACAQVSTPSASSSRASAARTQRALAERPHHDDAEAELLGQRQDLALDLALARVVGDLDGVDAAAAHHALELVEGRRAVVRRADRADLALVAQALEQVEPLAPADEVVDLVEVDAPAVPVRARARPGAAPRASSGVHSLVGDEGLVAAARRGPARASARPRRTSARCRGTWSRRRARRATTSSRPPGTSSVCHVPMPTTETRGPPRPSSRFSIVLLLVLGGRCGFLGHVSSRSLSASRTRSRSGCGRSGMPGPYPAIAAPSRAAPSAARPAWRWRRRRAACCAAARRRRSSAGDERDAALERARRGSPRRRGRRAARPR